ncbi:MAG: tRNA uridine-5-carboxymethylaminomethyl(34) synthesis GTPase MnmE, partial [Clostridia bacterium]|nr:tRNA uridine-5-carboxymethylaminomethyl(34) synthesis GTPase MnmE [Clostridia bacterium]
MSETIAAIATPQNTGSIGIIRVSGDDAIEIADRVFEPSGKRRLGELCGYRAAHGFATENGEKIDECVALVFRAPKSYTGENVVELSCHGGLFVLKRVLRALFSAGAKPAAAGEFTKRAFLNGKLDLAEAEAVMGLINAQNEQGVKAALGTLEGALSKRIGSLCKKLVASSAQLAAWVDYPDDEIPELENSEL